MYDWNTSIGIKYKVYSVGSKRWLYAALEDNIYMIGKQGYVGFKYKI